MQWSGRTQAVLVEATVSRVMCFDYGHSLGFPSDAREAEVNHTELKFNMFTYCAFIQKSFWSCVKFVCKKKKGNS